MAGAASTRRRARDFYREAVAQAEQIEDARELEGLDEEIAVLRVLLKNELQKLKDDPDRLQFVTKSLDLLVKAVAAKYRLSPKAQRDLSDSIAGVVRGVGAVLYPEGFPGDG